MGLSLGGRRSTGDPALDRAIKDIKRTTGDDVWPRKDLNKYGRVTGFGATETLVSEIFTKNSGITFANNAVLTKTSNVFDRVSSSNAGDTGTLTIEGHTYLNGNLTFVIQTKTLTGTTSVALDTPLRGVTRMGYNSGTTTPNAGDIYAFYGNDTAGVPDTAANIANVILANEGRTLHAATSFSQYDYFVITGVTFGLLKASAASAGATFRIRTRASTGSWITRSSLDHPKEAGTLPDPFKPYKWVGPNSDLAATVVGTTSSLSANYEFSGYICSILGSLAW